MTAINWVEVIRWERKSQNKHEHNIFFKRRHKNKLTINKMTELRPNSFYQTKYISDEINFFKSQIVFIKYIC